MGLVTDVFWVCPGCGSEEQAQVYGDWEDPTTFPVDAVPCDRGLKWNPPCENCGEFKLIEPPPVTVKYKIVSTKDYIDGEATEKSEIKLIEPSADT